ncbi:clavaminate synthase-like protein [Fusarium acuminatum]|uniref:Clavaminate synthase-like protein n=1 Tax=Fusarium acuminatum TaxID=5515 RepID=A0ABZ2WY97_9HYPO
MGIPLLDFRAYAQGNETEKARFCQDLRQTLATYGFARLRGHNISRVTIRELFSQAQRFFALPTAVKTKIAHGPAPNPHRGWSAVGKEKLAELPKLNAARDGERGVYDVRESLDLGSEQDTVTPNLWVPEADLPGFREFMCDFYEQCHLMHILLLQAVALSFSLDPQCLARQCQKDKTDNPSELRLNHYPATRAASLAAGNKTMRISPHTDFGLITLLFQDSVGGLEVERQELEHRGCYIPVEASASADDDAVDDFSSSTMILNVGDCLERWTNGLLPSANHRVTLPPRLKNQQDPDAIAPDRYSVAYFGKPDRQASVCSLPEFLLGEGDVPKFTEPMTAWEYNQSRLLHTY